MIIRRNAKLACQLVVVITLIALTSSALAVSGTWINSAGGVWSTTTNWSGGIVADGIDSTADFSTVLPGSASATITLNSPRTLGALAFIDNGNFRYTLSGTVANPLTLAVSSGTPTINALNSSAALNTTVISATLTGTQGFIKTGSAIVQLTGNNSLSGDITVSGGGLFMGSHTGNVTVNPGAVFSGAPSGTLLNNGTVQLSGTTSGRVTNNGIANLSTYTAGDGLENNSLMIWSVGGDSTFTIRGAGFENNGTIDFRPVGSGTDLVVNLDTSGPVVNVNRGVLDFPIVSDGQPLRLNNSTLSNTGTLDFNGQGVNSIAGTLINASGGIITGAEGVIPGFFSNAGGLLSVTGAPLVISDMTAGNTNGGELNIGPDSTLTVLSSIPSDGTIVLAGGNAKFAGGQLTNTGTLRGTGRVSNRVLNSGVVRAEAGDFTLSSSGNTNTSLGRIEVADGSRIIYSQGLAANPGQISLFGGEFDNNSRPLTNSGLINGHGEIRASALTNTGSLNVGGGDMNVLGSVVNSGAVRVQAGRTIYFFSNVSGPGSYTGPGTTVFLAQFSPGSSPASVTFEGNVEFSSGSSLQIELGGAAPGTQYDQVHVAGQLALDGSLDVSLINDFLPGLGDSFDLINWGALSGSFDSISLPSLGTGLSWDTTQIYSAGLITVVPDLPGDFNHDTVVDAADYVVWRKSDGPSQGYLEWRAHFGQTAAGGSMTSDVAGSNVAIPESTTGALLCAFVFSLGLCPRWRLTLAWMMIRR
jgi:autotransporter-associated beta strand protein